MSSESTPDRFHDELLSAYLDGELPEEERKQVESRLASDSAARRLLAELRAVSDEIQRLPTESIRSSLRDNVLAQVSSDSPAPERGKVSATELRQPNSKSFWLGSTRRWVWASMAVAAALLVMVMQERFLPRQRPLELARQSSRPVPDGDTDSAPAPELRNVPRTIEPAAEDENAEAEFADEMSLASETLERRTEERIADDRQAEGVSDGLVASDVDVPQLSQLAEPTADTATQENTPSLIVRLTMPQEARENRALENLFDRNAITFRSSDRLIGGRSSGNFRYKLPQDAPQGGTLAVEEYRVQSRGAASSATQSGQSPVPMRSSTAETASRDRSVELEERFSPENNVDVVFVQAAPAKVELCLSAIQQDEKNFLAVEVEEPASGNVNLGLQKELPTQSSAEHWLRYNRPSPTATASAAREPSSGSQRRWDTSALRRLADRGIAADSVDSPAEGSFGVAASAQTGNPLQVWFLVDTKASTGIAPSQATAEPAAVPAPSPDER